MTEMAAIKKATRTIGGKPDQGFEDKLYGLLRQSFPEGKKNSKKNKLHSTEATIEQSCFFCSQVYWPPEALGFQRLAFPWEIRKQILVLLS